MEVEEGAKGETGAEEKAEVAGVVEEKEEGMVEQEEGMVEREEGEKVEEEMAGAEEEAAETAETAAQALGRLPLHQIRCWEEYMRGCCQKLSCRMRNAKSEMLHDRGKTWEKRAHCLQSRGGGGKLCPLQTRVQLTG